MVSTVKTRPTHYEVLGLTPEATSEEIARAFAKELTSPRAFGSLAEVTVAFEALRDPARRKAYDESLAPAPKPEPLKFSPKAPADWAPFIARPSVTELPAIPSPPPPAPSPQPHPLVERLDSAPAPAPVPTKREPVLSEPRNAEPAPRIEPAPRPEPEPYRPDPIEMPRSDAHRALHFFDEDRGHESLLGAMKWKLPAFAVGCLLFSIVAGAWTGLNAGGDDQPDQPKRFARLKIASAETLPEAAPELMAEAPADLPMPSPEVRTTLPKQRVASTRRRVEAAAVQEAELEHDLAAQAVVEPASAPAPQARMPLPNAVVARTIGRIGYACGSVASTTAVEGSPGVFTVTCTSGHSYRAAPVNGRYRFRRL